MTSTERLHVADEAVLGHREEGRGALAVEILQQFVDVQDEGVLVRHRGAVAVEAVDRDGLGLCESRHARGRGGRTRRGEFCGVDLFDDEIAVRDHLLEVEAHGAGAIEHQAEFFVEDEHGGLLAARDRGGDELEDERALAGAGGPEHQHARPPFDAAAEQGVEFADAAR